MGNQFCILRYIHLLPGGQVRKRFIHALFHIPQRPVQHIIRFVTKLTVRVTKDGFGDFTGQGVIHQLAVLEILLVGLTPIIVVGEHLGRLPEQLQIVGAGAIGAGHRTHIEGGNLAGEVFVGVAGGQIDDDPLLQVGALVGVKGVGVTQRTRMMFEDDNVLILREVPPYLNEYPITNIPSITFHLSEVKYIFETFYDILQFPLYFCVLMI